MSKGKRLTLFGLGVLILIILVLVIIVWLGPGESAGHEIEELIKPTTSLIIKM
jgi:hypothetical protein